MVNELEYLRNDEPGVFSAPLGLLFKEKSGHYSASSCTGIENSPVFSYFFPVLRITNNGLF